MNNKLIRLPGLIDTHVHLREPGNTHKEDFETGTKAALAGGYTLILDMPNNPNPVVNPQTLEEKIKLTGDRIYSDVGFHFGGSGQSTLYFEEVKNKVFGLKVYMNHTTGPLLVEDQADLEAIFSSCPKEKVLMVHAEGETLKKAIELAKRYKNKLHVCHIAQKSELQLIQKSKDQGLNITCEVSMHHLYLTKDDVKKLKTFGMMRPPLATKTDQDYLWKNLASIDIIASDHAPHTKEEKLGPKPPNGVPGLETTLPLLLTMMSDKPALSAGRRLTLNYIQRMCHDNPRKIFNIPEQKNTYIEVAPDEKWTISNNNLYTKCGWSPFDGMKVKGRVKKVVLHGKTVFENGKIIGKPKGKVVYPNA